MTDHFTIEQRIQAKPFQIFKIWVDRHSHATITGGDYQVDPVVGGVFTAWDGYLSGTFLEINPTNRILMDWRASEFPVNEPNSVLEIVFDDKGFETLVTINHSNIPEGLGEQYRKGWFDFYLDPLCKHFSKINKTGCEHE